MSHFTGSAVAQACTEIAAEIDDWNKDHSNARPLQALILGRAGVYVWRSCINGWASTHRATLSKVISNDLWSSLYKHVDLITTFLPSDFVIQVSILGWRESGDRDIEQSLQNEFKQRVFNSSIHPYAGASDRVRCQVTFPHFDAPLIPASKLTISTSSNKPAIHVLTADPSVLLATNLHRLVHLHAHPNPHQESLADSWREAELLARLQESVKAYVDNNEPLRPFLLTDNTVAQGLSHCLNNQQYLSIRKCLRDESMDKTNPFFKLYRYFQPYFHADHLAPSTEVPPTSAASDQFPVFPHLPYTAQERDPSSRRVGLSLFNRKKKPEGGEPSS